MKSSPFSQRACGFILVVALSQVVSPACALAEPTTAPSPNSISGRGVLPGDINAEVIKRGRKLFHGRAQCFHCHGPNGSGTPVAPPLDDALHIHLRTASFEEFAERIQSGVPQPRQYRTKMPPAGGATLTNEEIRALSAYVFTLDRSP